MSVVLDASAVLAVLFREPGADRVIAAGEGSSISAINLAEVLTRAIDRQVPAPARSAVVDGLALRVVDFDEVAATATADLRAETRRLGLSLADRACLALAQQLMLPVLTGDRAWRDLDIGVEIVLIR